MSTTTEGDPRFTAGLQFDVVRVLEAHGYQRPATGPDLGARRQRATADTLLALRTLVRVFEALPVGSAVGRPVDCRPAPGAAAAALPAVLPSNPQ